MGSFEMAWLVPVPALLGLVAPYYSTEWLGFLGEAQRPAVELACGLLPPVILAAAVLRLREAFLRPWRWDLAALGFVLTLCILPSVSPFRWSFRWLPLFHLLLALLSAHALTALRADEARAPGARRVTSFGIVLAVLGCVAVEWAVIHAPGFSPGDLALRAILLIAAVAAAFFCWPRLGSFELLIRWLPCLVVVLSLWSTYSHVETRFVRRWALTESIRRPEPLDPEILYLGVYDAHEAYRIDSGLSHLIRPGNIGMYSGVRLLNGYSTIGPAGLARVLRMRSHFGYSADTPARRILEAETGRGGLLELMGVDGLVLTERWRSQVKHPEGWETAFSSEKGAVLHRTTRTPEVRWIPSVKITSPTMIPDRIIRRSSPQVPWLVARSDSSPPEGSLVEYAPCTLAVVRSSRLEVAVEVESLSSERNSLVLFSRPWYPGYRATLDGQTLRVHALNLVMPAVEIPAGAKGTVVLRYSPATLRIGLTVSALALVAGVAASGARWPASRRKPRPPRPRGRRPPARRD